MKTFGPNWHLSTTGTGNIISKITVHTTKLAFLEQKKRNNFCNCFMFVNHRNMIVLQKKIGTCTSFYWVDHACNYALCLDLFQWGQILSEVVFQSLKTLSQIYFGIFNVLLTIVTILKGKRKKTWSSKLLIFKSVFSWSKKVT